MTKVYDMPKSAAVTGRIGHLIDNLMSGTPEIEAERAVLITESFKQTEHLPMIIRRAKALEHILQNMTLVIRDKELIVGNLTAKPRGCQIFPEFSNRWLLCEFATVARRTGDVFTISDDAVSKLKYSFEYWNGRTVQELATSFMSPEALTAIDAEVFTVGNYYNNGVGHISVDYGKVLSKGFKGIIEEAQQAKAEADRSLPDYIKKEQFLNAVIISAEAAIQFGKRFAELAKSQAAACSDGVRQRELLQIARNCEQVPANPASSFSEAVQCFWFVHMLIQVESNGHSVSPMRFDQYMYPYYKQDIERGTLRHEEAQELLDCLWVKLNEINKIRDEASSKAFGGYPMFQNLVVGGQNEEGLDATNELSFACLEATAHVKLPQPSVSIRVWNRTPDELLLKAAEVSRLGLGLPAYYNDEVIIPALVSRSVSLADARDYGLIGCVEPQKGGKTEGWHDAAFFNLPKVMEFVIGNGTVNGKKAGIATGDFASFTSLDEIMEAYRKQMEHFVNLLAQADNSVDYAHAERAPLPFLSSMVYDCIGRGKSLQEGGAFYNFTGPQGVGIANVADAMYAIQKVIFEERKTTLPELKAALERNFGLAQPAAATASAPVSLDTLTQEHIVELIKKFLMEGNQISLAQFGAQADVKVDLGNSQSQGQGNDARLREWLIAAPKYGNDIEEVDELARQVGLVYCREVQKHVNPRGGTFQPGLYPASANVPLGAATGATADGRLAGEPLADGVSPVSGRDTSGPTASANSVAKLDHHIASNGTLFNQKFHPSALSGPAGLEKLAALVRGFFDQKGMHVQFNVISRDTLLEAQRNPEKYKNLVVRVAGYSAHFTTLDKKLQDDIINRTEQTM
ncbi:glycyl radical protein [Paenibacillus macerans]|uniref:glycyl radical protein n=1 Tax=Paenibacillus macerans TaxID=44252 RepID=UPI00203D47CA|nr:glycyl radical protein [Paenibacillus macerans]MCM3700671.1 glycyl radical protein [Paenibacillus macerans]